MSRLKIALPPRPSKSKAAKAAPAPPPPNPADLSKVKAVAYRIEFTDGTSLQAHGEHADLIFRYLNECEQFCAQEQKINFLAPAFTRYDAEGKPMTALPFPAGSVRS